MKQKLFTLLTMLAFTFIGVLAQEHSTQTGQNFLTAKSLTDGVAAATKSYLVSLQIHAGSTFYINNEGKAQSDFSTTGETTWIVEKTSDSKYLLRTFSGKYIKTLGENNNTAVTFTTNSSEALKFNPTQSTSTDSNMESGYVANKAIWWNVDGGSKRINTNGISGGSKTIFQNTGEGCWTCLFTYQVSISSGYNGYIGANKTIGETEWKTQSNWVHTDTWKTGPGYTESNMWSPIYLQDVTATGIAFEGWNLRLKLVNSSLTATTVKLQTGVPSTIDVDENSTLNLTLSKTNNGTWTRTFNIDGRLTISMGTCSWSTGSNTNTINLGTTGQFTLTANSAQTTPAASSFAINATLTNPTANNTIKSRTLATFTNVTVTTLTPTISGTDGWTLVESKDALKDQIFNGKYYYVEKTSTGVTLYTYKETTKFTENSTQNLSDVENYNSRESFLVPSGSTLVIDVENVDLSKITGTGKVGAPSGESLVVNYTGFDLTRITGAEDVIIDADVTISGNKSTVATGKLTINEGKTLTIGTGDTQTNSIASFTSIDLVGTIKHNNKKATLNNVTVPTGKTGKIFAFDMGEDADGFKLAGTTTLDGNLTVCSKWNFQMKVDELAGSGTWLICGTTGSDFNASGTSSNQDAVINIGSSPDFTGTIHGNNSNASVNVKGTLANCTFKANHGTPALADGAVLDGVILDGSKRINTTGNVTIRDLAGNNLNDTNSNYAFVGSGTLNFYGTCDLTKKSDGTDCNSSKLGYGKTDYINIKDGANVTTAGIYNTQSSDNNAYITVESGATLTATGVMRSISATNNGTMSGTTLYGPITLGEGSTTTLSDATPFHDNSTTACTITVNGDATLNLTATTAKLHKPITIAADKTFTIDCASKTANLDVVPTFGTDSKINFKNATINYNNSIRSLANYTFTSCTAQFTETGTEYAAGGFTITNIPSGVTIKVKKYDASDYETVTPVDGTVTISHSVGVSGSAAWLDYTFNESTKATNLHSPADQTITNAGNAGITNNDLTIDGSYTTATSYNDDGTLKVMATPWRNITWPTNYTVAVAGNVPDVENGCLVAFGTHNGGYLAIIRGASQNEIKLVKGSGNNAFEVISTMTAANATALSHLVVFTKNGNTFTVYLDGVQKTQVTYSETLGGGLQVGSLHGDITDTGLVRVDKMSDATAKAKVFAKTIRVYDYVISADQMDQLKEEFPYVSFGGKYSRTITTNSNLSATNAWLNEGTHGNVDVPTNAIVDEVTYYPDVEITTTAASTLTVNADMAVENFKFDGSGKLTIASDGEHNISIYGSVTANGPVSVKYGEIDLTAVPVTIGESGSVEFDFSYYDFSSYTQTSITTTRVTGNASDYGDKVVPVYPSSDTYDFSFAYNSENHWYELTVTPKLIAKKQEALDMVTPYYNGNYVGTGLNKYTISLGETSYANMKDFGDAVTSWETLGDCVEPTIVINQPATGKFYRFHIGDDYMCNVAAENIRTTTTTADDASTIFYLDENNYLMAYADGYGFNYGYCKAIEPGIFNSFDFSESSTICKYLVHSNPGTESNAYSNRYITVSESKLAEGQGEWTIEEVTSLPVTISAAKYATLYSPVALTIPEGVTAYVATDHETYLHLDAIEGGIIPAETGVILAGDAGTYSFAITTGGTAESELTGTIAAIARPSGSYILATGSSGVAFYGDGASTIPGFKSYLAASTGGTRTFHFGDITAVKAIEAAQNSGKVVYDMNGRRVENPAKGLYIVNGKKVFINKK